MNTFSAHYPNIVSSGYYPQMVSITQEPNPPVKNFRTSVYSTAWNILTHSFDYKGSLDNWATFADEICIAVGTSEDDTYDALETYAVANGYPVRLIRTSFDFATDSFAYGKTENSALQACTGDILIQQNLDERFRVSPERLAYLYEILRTRPEIAAFWVPTIDLYGAVDRYLPPHGKKWYIHRRGLFRGAVGFGIKEDGRPDYSVTSTDELLGPDGNLVPTAAILKDNTLEGLQAYVSEGWPVSYHVGYLSFNERLSRSLWWKERWEAWTGDANKHPTSVEEIANRETKPHGLPLWEPQP